MIGIILTILLFSLYCWFFFILILLFLIILLVKLNCVFFIFFVFECLFLNVIVLNFKTIIRLRFLLIQFISISLFYVNTLFFCLFHNMSLSLFLVISLFKFLMFSSYFLEHRLDSSRLIVASYILISKFFYLVPVLILLNGRNPLINYIFLFLNLKPYIILGWFLFLIILFNLLFLNPTNFILFLINYSSFLVLFSLILGSKYFTLLLLLDFLLFSFMCFLLFFDFSWLGVKSLFILFFYFMFIFGIPPFPTFILDMLIIYFFTFISNFFVLVLLFFYSFLVYLFLYLSVFFKINFSLVNRRKLIVSLSSFILFILLLKIFISFYYFNVFLSFFIFTIEDLIEALDAILSVFLSFIVLFAPFGFVILFLILIAYLLGWLKDLFFGFIDKVVNPILSYLYESIQKIKAYDFKKTIFNIKLLLLANIDYEVFYSLYFIFYLFTIKGWIVIIFFKFLYALMLFIILSTKLLSVFFMVFCVVTLKILSIYSTGVYIFFHFFILRQVLIYYTPWFISKFNSLYNLLVNYLTFLRLNYKFYSYLEEFIIRRLRVLVSVKDSTLIEARNIIPTFTYFSNSKLLSNFISLLLCLVVLSFFIYFTFLLANLVLFFLIPSVASRFFTLKFPIPFYNICVPLVILLILLVSLVLIYSCDIYLLGMFWALLILLLENVKMIFNRCKMVFNNDFKYLCDKISFNFPFISKHKDRGIEVFIYLLS